MQAGRTRRYTPWCGCSLNPAYVEPYLSLGDIYLQLDMPQDAIETYNSYLLEHRPGPRILANLAWACAKAGILDEAIDIREADINDRR